MLAKSLEVGACRIWPSSHAQRVARLRARTPPSPQLLQDAAAARQQARGGAGRRGWPGVGHLRRDRAVVATLRQVDDHLLDRAVHERLVLDRPRVLLASGAATAAVRTRPPGEALPARGGLAAAASRPAFGGSAAARPSHRHAGRAQRRAAVRPVAIDAAQRLPAHRGWSGGGWAARPALGQRPPLERGRTRVCQSTSSASSTTRV